ncbi:MAG TPA: MFS transporter [Spirochaetota bacterium]|jgi:Na+/melibiose symporter-like transporter|nr:MAG: Major Facilitator Superfamily protein [Spirochaetes bacterium ADurb.Bin133]HNZ28266.1 MFS transporter [Spirochaetota bacterium]HPY87324.1 MFS transporter [Spirochaetota bacterium]
MEENEKMKIGKTFLLGFGFLGISIIWPLYNSYVPIFLKGNFGLSSTAIGVIMTIDNVFAVILLPFLGALSDKTVSVLGRRRPYILIGAPLAMVFFSLLPFAAQRGPLLLLMSIIILLNLSMALYRTPVIALMPDITPSKYRSRANGIINFMGGVGALIAFFGGKALYDKNVCYPFIAGGIFMFIACILVVIFMNEDKSADPAETGGNSFILKDSIKSLTQNLKDVITGEKSLLFILLAIFFWFVGFNSIETFFTSYAKFYLGMKESTGGLILGFYSLSFMLFAIVSGIIGMKWNRNNTIKLGLFLLVIIVPTVALFKDFVPLAILFALAGISWSLVNVNSLPMVVDMTIPEKVGGFTGLYYFFSQLANIVSPPVSGFIIDLSTKNGEKPSGYISLLVFSSTLFLVSLIIMFFVKRGEAK